MTHCLGNFFNRRAFAEFVHWGSDTARGTQAGHLKMESHGLNFWVFLFGGQAAGAMAGVGWGLLVTNPGLQLSKLSSGLHKLPRPNPRGLVSPPLRPNRGPPNPLGLRRAGSTWCKCGLEKSMFQVVGGVGFTAYDSYTAQTLTMTPRDKPNGFFFSVLLHRPCFVCSILAAHEFQGSLSALNPCWRPRFLACSSMTQ